MRALCYLDDVTEPTLQTANTEFEKDVSKAAIWKSWKVALWNLWIQSFWRLDVDALGLIKVTKSRASSPPPKLAED